MYELQTNPTYLMSLYMRKKCAHNMLMTKNNLWEEPQGPCLKPNLLCGDDDYISTVHHSGFSLILSFSRHSDKPHLDPPLWQCA